MNNPICPICYRRLKPDEFQDDGAGGTACVCPGCGQTFILEDGELKVVEMEGES